MTYYILFDNEEKKNLDNDANILGETTTSLFYTSLGFRRFVRAIDAGEIECFKIFDEKGKDYTIKQFLDVISKYNIAEQF